MASPQEKTPEEIVAKFFCEGLARSFSLTRAEDEIEASLETPKERQHGDLAFPCHTLARELKKPPTVIATELAAALTEFPNVVSKVEVLGPYVNVFLNQTFIASSLIPSIVSGNELARRPSKKERVMIEYSQPNTHKAFHVGHIRCASLGDALCRIFSWLGSDVVPVNYIGDEGTHVAKCLWYYQTFYPHEKPTQNRGEFLGKLYTEATGLLDLEALTEAPFPSVITAKISSIAIHPKKPSWRVLQLVTDNGEKTVVTAAEGGVVGDTVGYAPVGTRFGTKTVGVLEKDGVTSEGMVLSEKEAGHSESNDTLWIITKRSDVGVPVTELFRTDPSSQHHTPVLTLLKEREAQVSGVLKRIEAQEPEMKAFWEETRQWSLDEFAEIYRWLDCRFDHYFFESEFGERSKELVRRYQEKGVFIPSDGAVGADLSKYKLGFCLLIKRDGTALYATRDLTLAEDKFSKYNIDRSIYIVDSAQTLHFQQVFKCLELMGYQQASQCYHLPYAQVVRPDGKMSSRKGNVILFSELKKRLIEKATVEFLEKYRGTWSDEEIDHAAYVIALATIRYGMLKPENNSVVVFDLDEWSERSGNTGPYMLYACARIQSILKELGTLPSESFDASLLLHETEIDVIRGLRDFNAVVERAGAQYAPHLLCAYVYDLSKRFNRMYKVCSVLHAETSELRASRATLVAAVGSTIKAGLSLLGIPTLERM